jgi:hypothetical protein
VTRSKLNSLKHRNGQKNFDSKLSTKKDIFFLHENLTEILPYIIFILFFNISKNRSIETSILGKKSIESQ